MNGRPATPQSLRNPGFTLIELLVVLSIVAILATMLMPIMSIASRAAKKTATRSVMHKTDTALRLFKNDIGSYPFQRTYADTSIGEKPDNRLYYHLGRDIALADLKNLYQDAEAAAGQYAYDCSGFKENPAVSPHVYRKSDIKPSASTNGSGRAWDWVQIAGVWQWEASTGDDDNKLATAAMLNNMAQERARLAIFAGNVDLTGTTLQPAYSPTGALYAAGRDNAAAKILAMPASDGKPGWAGDYLHGELEKRFITGEVILDAWKHPLVYVCQVVEGVKSVRGFLFHANLRYIDSHLYGVAAMGRRTLAAIDPATGVATVADPPSLPDASNLRNSDRRFWASRGFEEDVELWSAGPDGRFDWMRPHAFNQDNLPLIPYDKDL